MLFDWGWSELMLIGIVALVVIGPKDLPRAMRIAGYWLKRARDLSREFQNNVEDMMRESELEEMRQGLQKATEFDPDHEIGKSFDPDGSLHESLTPPDLPDYSANSHEHADEPAPDYPSATIETAADEVQPPQYTRRGVPGFRVRGAAKRPEAAVAEPAAGPPSDDASAEKT